jgi:sugar fermentation stimulation protein A
MRFDPPLVRATFLRRYKRFFADVRLEDGRVVTAHCPNTGSLTGCLRDGAPALIAAADRPGRTLPWTWRMVRVGRTWVGLDTSIAVPLVAEAIARGLIPELGGYERALTEVPYGVEGRSRIDLLLSRGGRPTPAPRGRRVLFQGDARVYVEVKSTTLTLDRAGQRHAAFPDAVTERGRKHLHELLHVVRSGHRAAIVFSAQRSDCVAFEPALAIDPRWAGALREAIAGGVEAYAFGARVGPRAARLDRRLPILL